MCAWQRHSFNSISNTSQLFRQRIWSGTRWGKKFLHASHSPRMPVIVHKDLSAYQTLTSEGVWVVSDPSKIKDVPRLKIGLMNLMPLKPPTETQILRMMGRSPVFVDVTLFVPDGYPAKSTSPEYMQTFYKKWSQIKDEKFDGFIVTGAPIETLEFEQVRYWKELQAFFDQAVATNTPLLTLCWGAMASLYHFHKVPKYTVPRKLFGVFPHANLASSNLLMQGLGAWLRIPVSRHSTWRTGDMRALPPGVEVVLDSEEAGPCLVWDEGRGHAHMINHFEYDAGTLNAEFVRDLAKGTPTGDPIHVPHYYFPKDDPKQLPPHSWQSEGQVFYSNWLTAVLRRKTTP